MAATNNAQQVWQSFDGEDFLHLLGLQGGTIVAYIDANGAYQGGVGPLAAAAQPTFRAIDSEPTLSFAGSTAITGSVAAIRGNTTIASGTTITSGFVYGTQGKVTVKGTLATANFTAGIVGQLDLSTATLTASGPVAAIWGDMGASLSASAIADAANLNVVLLTDTHVGAAINSAIKVETNSTYLLDLSNASYASGYATSATAGTQIGRIKIKLPSGDGYIDVTSLS
jgi:hypothetical protein